MEECKGMLPYFFAAGHANYARYGVYYLHSMTKLPKEILEVSERRACHETWLLERDMVRYAN